MFNIVLLLTVLFGVTLNIAETSRILAFFPIHGKSHYTAFENLAKELVNRGHELVVINNFPQKNKIKGLTDIDVTNYTTSCVSFAKISDFNPVPTGTLNDMRELYDLLPEVFGVFEVPEVKQLISSDKEHFDLLIAEMFNTDIALGFAYKYKIPIIGFQFSTFMPWITERFANPQNPSYIPCISSQYHNKMNFLQRLGNSLETWISVLVYKYFYNTQSNIYAKKYFGEDLPPLEELANNSTMILFNSHHSIHGARPLLPAVVEVGGLHIGPQKDIPKDLEKFINESEHGVIYFCMGSMLKASTLPEEKRKAIIKVFSKLPQRVLWKWETENMPDKPDNVKLAKWMPQRDILAHPNIKLFISHGGLLGVTEAVYSGVPIIGMPFYGDQGVNVEAVKAAGAGLRLDFHDLNEHSLYEAIKEILENPKYKEDALQLSIRFKDRPQTPLETAVYWTEYVIRHKGAPHLRSAAVDLAWYQYLLLDVIAFLLVSFIVISAIIFYTFRFIFRFIKKILFKRDSTKVNPVRKNQ